MSVVNKMLQDLDARGATTDGSNADYQPPKKRSYITFWLLLLGAILILLALGGYYWSSLADTLPSFDEPQPSRTHLPINDTASKSAPAASNLPIKSPNQERNVHQGKKVAPAPSHASTLNKPHVEGENTSLNRQEQTLQLPPVVANKLPISKPITTAPNSQQPPVMARGPVKPKSNFSKQVNAENDAQAGLKQTIHQALRAGETMTAIKGLQRLLRAEPDNLLARKKLASLLFSTNRMAKAQSILTEGIEQHPEQYDLRLMLARLLTQQDNAEQAFDLLARKAPSIALFAEYYAFRGALAQQLDNYLQAQSDYQMLAKAEPNQAKWWLGLGIAQDSLAQHTQALKSYQKAYDERQLSPEVLTFVRQRLNDLAGIK